MKKSSHFYYSKEVKSILAAVVIAFGVAAFIKYKTGILSTILSEQGMLVSLGLVVAGVASLVIRIYYRVMIIRYSK